MEWKKLKPAFFATPVAPGGVIATRTVTALALAAVFALASCAQPQKPADVKSSVLGVVINLVGGAERIDEVYFVRLGTTDRVRGHFPRLRSNFRRGDRFYLLNAPPGRYAAVAASKRDPGAVSRRSFYSPNTFHTTYFGEPMIRKTIVEVEPGRFAFMGTFSVRKDLDFYAGDETQAHYRSLIEPTLKDPYQPGVADPEYNSFSYGALLLTADREPRTEAIFLNAALGDLEKSGWESLLRKRLEVLGSK